MKKIRVGNGCGFWGDNLDAPARLVRSGQLDYLTLEYLAELTLSILAIQKQKNPSLGYATDFIEVLRSVAPLWREQRHLKIITNAGGLNPRSCAEAAQQVLREQQLPDVRIGIVSGDDLLPQLDDLLAQGHMLNHMDTGEPLASVRERVVCANAYLGARPIVEALQAGAQLVITGRVADASLTVAPAVFEFGWGFGPADVDRLAAATVAGHLIECGAQVTGGLWINATAQTRFADIGYPIAEIAEDGSFVLTKPVGSGGAVNFETVAEQLLYEVADPRAYYTPDVVADFTTVTLEQVAADAVAIRGACGVAIPENYKVSVAYHDGYMAAGMLVLVGPGCIERARHSGQVIFERLRQAGWTYQRRLIEVLGSGDAICGITTAPIEPPEVVLRVAVHDQNRAAVERFTRELAPLVTSGFAGTTGYTTGRPPVREVFAFWPALIARSVVSSRVEMLP
jgi:hypothetical protein